MREPLVLPAPEDVDALPVDSLPAIVGELAALQAYAFARLTREAAAAPPSTTEDTTPYSLDDAAGRIRKSPAWLRRQANAGDVPGARKVGRSWLFPRTDFERYWQRHRRG